MVYAMTLVILGASNTEVTAVNSPVALMRGGASPALPPSGIIAQYPTCQSSDLFGYASANPCLARQSFCA